MSFQTVPVEFTVTDNILEVTPTDAAILDNSSYKIKITGIKALDGTEMPDQSFNIITALTPMYCSLSSLKAVTVGFDIDDSTMLTYIREASQFADFVASATSSASSSTNKQYIEYAKGELTKVKATLDCLSSGFIAGSFMQGGNRYKLGEDEIEEGNKAASFKNLLDWLKWLLRYWMDAVRGYINPGHAKPKATRIGIKSADNQDVSFTTVESLIDDITRDMPRWS